jgi:hypothetical protein
LRQDGRQTAAKEERHLPLHPTFISCLLGVVRWPA